ncbi:MAG: YdcF family protein [Deltaproteobacteria bacterium]|nr:YdcF family protein [Deltaproteobacteria bacterium]
MFKLIKFVYGAMQPLALITWLLAISLILITTRRKNGGVRLGALCLVLLYALSTEPVANGLLYPLETMITSPPAQTVKGDVIVLLGGGTRPQYHLSPIPELSQSGGRILLAAYLFRLAAAPRILVMGGSGDPFRINRQEALEMKTLLVKIGIPAAAILEENQSRTTNEHIDQIKAFLREKGFKHLILVTSASHMPRAYQLFRTLGVDVVPMQTDYLIQEPLTPAGFLPSPGVLRSSTRAIHEYLALAYYKLMGWF